MATSLADLDDELFGEDPNLSPRDRLLKRLETPGVLLAEKLAVYDALKEMKKARR